MSTKILIADDHDIVRKGLRTLIEQQPDMEVVGEANNGRTTLRLVQKLKPDVVIMDITMPDLNGIEATRQISAEMPDTKVIALSMHTNRLFVEKMLRAGASGYLTKDCDIKELLRAVRAVVKGQNYLSPTITSCALEAYKLRFSPKDPKDIPYLTPREREVLVFLVDGNTAKEIASKLYVSVKTVEAHRRNIMTKLGIKSLAGLTRYAIREELTSLGESTYPKK